MGAKFASSMGNFFMAKWEEDVVLHDRRLELVTWKRFIDDVLLIWDGDIESVTIFLSFLNDNDRGIILSYEISPTQMHFLDLKITIVNERVITSMFFKATDRNGYIPLDSCHHHSWLSAVPKGQFLRLRRNCTDLEEFKREALVLKSRFLTKGYDNMALDSLITEIGNRDHQALLGDKPPQVENREDFGLAFLTTYSSQHWAVKRIIKRHWPVIKNDRVLGPLLSVKPCVLFRGASNLRHSIAPDVPVPPIRPTFFGDLKGFFPCRKCQICKLNAFRGRRLTEFTLVGSGTTHSIVSFITCTTKCVVYLLRCPCGLEYIGRTI